MSQAIDLKLLEPILDEVSNGVTIANAQNGELPLIFVNRAFEQMTGYGADSALGRNWRECLSAARENR